MAASTGATAAARRGKVVTGHSVVGVVDGGGCCFNPVISRSSAVNTAGHVARR